MGAAPYGPGWPWALLALAGLATTWSGWASRTRPWIIFAGLAIAVSAAGVLRTGQERARLVEWDDLGLPPREARLTLKIERLFAPNRERPDAAGGIARVVATENHLRDLNGQRIQFFATWPTDAGPPLRGAEFVALGLLRPVPTRPEAGSFDQFLADAGVNFAFSRGRVEGITREAGLWSRFCGATGQKLEAILRTGLENETTRADLFVAMMLGQKEEIGEERRDWFIRSGTMHLFAISGLHIAGIAVVLNTLLGLARVPPVLGFVVGTALLWIFVQTTGGAPSAVRAFWMITCLLGAKRLRLPSNSLAALSTSALVVLAIEPHQLFSAGFQMSYGIVAALLLYGVPLHDKWREAWQPGAGVPVSERVGWRRWADSPPVHGLMSVAALGLAATLVSLPATVAFFSLMTPGGFFVNLILVPSAGLVLCAGVISMVCGLAGLAPLASLFNHAAAMVLAGMEGAVVLAIKVPGGSWPAQFATPWLGPATMAGIVGLLALGYMRGWAAREGGYWAVWIPLGLVLVLGVRSI